MGKNIKLINCLYSISILKKFYVEKARWITEKDEIIQLIIKQIERDELFLICFTKIIYYFMNNLLIKERWYEVWLGIYRSLYEKDIMQIEVMLNSIEKLKPLIRKKIAFVDVYKMFLADRIMNEEDSLNKLIVACCQEKYGSIKRKTIRFSIEVFSDWSHEDEKRNKLLAKCDAYVAKENNSKNLIALFHLLANGKCITQAFFRQYCMLVYQCEEEEIRYYYGVHELSWLVFLHPHLLYEDYHIERKKFLKHTAIDIWNSFDGKSLKKKGRHENRIAVMVDGLAGKVYASARLEIYLANEFARRGYEVTIFVADSNRRAGDFVDFLNPSGTRQTSSRMYEEEHSSMIADGVFILYNEELNYKERFEQYVKSIYEYSPDFILDILGDRTLFDYVLISDFPIITVPLAGVSSCAKYDYIIIRNFDTMKEVNKECYSVEEEKAIEGNLYIPYKLESQKQFTRKKLHINLDDYVVVTVGNRLKTDITLDFAREMASLLNRHENIKWLVVGAWRNEYEFLKDFFIKRRIICTGFVNELPALYRICDVFLNPIRSGGGGSVAMFIQMGLPAIISSKPSDILPFVGVENCVKGDLKSMFEAVERIYYDKKSGQELAKRQKENLMNYKFTVESYANSVLALRKKVPK